MINSLYLILRFFEKIKHFKIYKKKIQQLKYI